MGSQEWLWIFVFVQSFSFALDWFSEVAMNVSSEIAWGIIGDNSCFLLKKYALIVSALQRSLQNFANVYPLQHLIGISLASHFMHDSVQVWRNPSQRSHATWLTETQWGVFINTYQYPKVVTNGYFQVQWPRQHQGCRGQYIWLHWVSVSATNSNTQVHVHILV